MIAIQENSEWFNHRLADGGPIYMETHPGQLIVEPWNAVSALLILIPAIFWLRRLKQNHIQAVLMYLAIGLIIAGGLGSALFHGFRASMFFLLMDILPSALLSLFLTIFFWIKVLKRWWYIFFILVPLFLFRFLLWGKLPEQASINLSYFLTGLGIAIPVLIYLFMTKFRNWTLIAMTILSFGAALTFRQIDHIPIHILPMGTHFLWHTFSALGTWFILDYLYLMISPSPKQKSHGQNAS